MKTASAVLRILALCHEACWRCGGGRRTSDLAPICSLACRAAGLLFDARLRRRGRCSRPVLLIPAWSLSSDNTAFVTAQPVAEIQSLCNWHRLEPPERRQGRTRFGWAVVLRSRAPPASTHFAKTGRRCVRRLATLDHWIVPQRLRSAASRKRLEKLP
jgi:hypothetical protein